MYAFLLYWKWFTKCLYSVRQTLSIEEKSLKWVHILAPNASQPRQRSSARYHTLELFRFPYKMNLVWQKFAYLRVRCPSDTPSGKVAAPHLQRYHCRTAGLPKGLGIWTDLERWKNYSLNNLPKHFSCDKTLSHVVQLVESPRQYKPSDRRLLHMLCQYWNNKKVRSDSSCEVKVVHATHMFCWDFGIRCIWSTSIHTRLNFNNFLL